MVKSKNSVTGQARQSLESFVNARLNEYLTISITPEERKELRSRGLNGSTVLQVWMDENGAYGSPTILAPNEFDAYVKANKLRVIHRGCADAESMTAVEMHEQFLYGQEYFVGKGMFGDGQYFGDKKTAEMYALDGYFVQGSGAVIKAALKPSARVITADRLIGMARSEYPILYMSEGFRSVYARSMGYDAIVAGQEKDGYVCVINRDALVVSSDIRRVHD